MKFYCVKCRKHQEVKDYKTMNSKNGKQMAYSQCPQCGSKMVKFMKK